MAGGSGTQVLGLPSLRMPQRTAKGVCPSDVLVEFATDCTTFEDVSHLVASIVPGERTKEALTLPTFGGTIVCAGTASPVEVELTGPYTFEDEELFAKLRTLAYSGDQFCLRWKPAKDEANAKWFFTEDAVLNVWQDPEVAADGDAPLTFSATLTAPDVGWNTTGSVEEGAGEPATGVVAGTPGYFTPSGSTPPANLTELNALGYTGTAWQPGQYVVVGGTSYTWDGDTWEVFTPIAATDVTAGTPATYVPTGAQAPADFAALQSSLTSAMSGDSAWTTGQYALLGDNSHAYWDGTAWVVGNAP
jgi:hypothetical protein